MQVIVNRGGADCASDVISQYLSWSSTNYNLSKYKDSELVLKKKGQGISSPIGNIEQAEFSSATRSDFLGQWQIYRTRLTKLNSSKRISASTC